MYGIWIIRLTLHGCFEYEGYLLLFSVHYRFLRLASPGLYQLTLQEIKSTNQDPSEQNSTLSLPMTWTCEKCQPLKFNIIIINPHLRILFSIDFWRERKEERKREREKSMVRETPLLLALACTSTSLVSKVKLRSMPLTGKQTIDSSMCRLTLPLSTLASAHLFFWDRI